MGTLEQWSLQTEELLQCFTRWIRSSGYVVCSILSLQGPGHCYRLTGRPVFPTLGKFTNFKGRSPWNPSPPYTSASSWSPGGKPATCSVLLSRPDWNTWLSIRENFLTASLTHSRCALHIPFGILFHHWEKMPRAWGAGDEHTCPYSGPLEEANTAGTKLQALSSPDHSPSGRPQRPPRRNLRYWGNAGHFLSARPVFPVNKQRAYELKLHFVAKHHP